MSLSASPTVLFTNAAGTVAAHPAGYASVRYHAGSWDAPELAELLTYLGQELLRRRWTSCLADAGLMPPLSADSKAWLEAHWLGAGARRPQPLQMALVQPAEVFARLAVAEMQAQNHGSSYYTYFASEAEAHAWLLGQLASAAGSR